MVAYVHIEYSTYQILWESNGGGLKYNYTPVLLVPEKVKKRNVFNFEYVLVPLLNKNQLMYSKDTCILLRN